MGRETAETCGLQAYVRLIEYQFLSKSWSKSSAEPIERMRNIILMAVAAIAFSGTAYALESGATCDDGEEDIEQQIVLEGTTPSPDESPAPGS